jgi:hypothetical protein
MTVFALTSCKQNQTHLSTCGTIASGRAIVMHLGTPVNRQRLCRDRYLSTVRGLSQCQHLQDLRSQTTSALLKPKLKRCRNTGCCFLSYLLFIVWRACSTKQVKGSQRQDVHYPKINNHTPTSTLANTQCRGILGRQSCDLYIARVIKSVTCQGH